MAAWLPTERDLSSGLNTFLRWIKPVTGKQESEKCFPPYSLQTKIKESIAEPSVEPGAEPSAELGVESGVEPCAEPNMKTLSGVHLWFRNLVDMVESDENSRPFKRWAIEENMVVRANIKYKTIGKKKKKEVQISKLKMEIIIVDPNSQGPQRTVEDFYLDPSIPYHYFRLEYDLGSLGNMFNHPHPHIHTVPDGAPRFSGPCVESGNIVVDFFDFLYRNYYHDKWLSWARSAYEAHGEILQGLFDSSNFDSIAALFSKSNHELLMKNHEPDLRLIKKACRHRKDEIFEPRIDIRLSKTLAYDICF